MIGRARRLFVLSVALGWLLLLCVGSVRAQCQPSNQPTISGNHNIFTPSDIAAQGYVTATMTVIADAPGGVSGGGSAIASKKVTVTPGVGINITVSSNNGSATKNGGPYAYWTYLGDPNQTQHFEQYMPLSGTFNHWWVMDNSQIGYTYILHYVVPDAYGRTTQDQIYVKVQSGNSGVLVSQDGNSSNLYVMISGNYSGTPQIDFNTCSQATEKPATPTASLTVSNINSGENQSASNSGSTGVIDDQYVLNAGTSVIVSALPGDTVSGTFGGSTYCTALGTIWQTLLSWRIEYAKVVAKDLGHVPKYNPNDKSYIYDVAPICDNNSDPPDWQPTVVHSWVGRRTWWWGVTSLVRWPDVQGAAWVPLSTYLTDWTQANPSATFPLNLAKMVIEGGAVPYPANTGPDFPLPGACTQYPKNVVLTVGSSNLPWWPANN